MIFKTGHVPRSPGECFSKLKNYISFSHFNTVAQVAMMSLVWGQIEKLKRQDSHGALKKCRGCALQVLHVGGKIVTSVMGFRKWIGFR